MPRKALTLFSCRPRILPEVVLATGPCAELSLAFAAIALLNAPPRMPDAPSAAPLTKDRRLILVCMVSGDHFTSEGGDRVSGGDWGGEDDVWGAAHFSWNLTNQ